MDETIERLEKLAPAALDEWVRQQLGRRMVVVGLTLTPAAPNSPGEALGEPPAELLAGLAAYAEIWVRWSDAGTRVSEAMRLAAQLDADVVVGWIEAPRAERQAPADWPRGAVATLVGEADDLNLRDRCVFALAGSAAMRELARRAGCDAGFATGTPLAHIAGTLAREAAAREEFRRKGSSPPCYL